MEIRATKAFLKEIQRLKQKKYRVEKRLFVAEGERLCEDALQSGWKIEHFFLSHAYYADNLRTPILDNIRRQCTYSVLNATDFQKLASTINSQGILAVINFPHEKLEFAGERTKTQTIIAFEKLNDPGNFGTIIRTAAWFGMAGILTSPENVAWHNDKVVRASMGGIFSVPIQESDEFDAALRHLKSQGFVLIAADQNSTASLSSFEAPAKTVLLLGDEARGISNSLRPMIDQTISIPGTGKVDSLNVANAAAIFMAHFYTNANR